MDNMNKFDPLLRYNFSQNKFPWFDNENLNNDFKKLYEDIKIKFSVSVCDQIVYDILRFAFIYGLSTAFNYVDESMEFKMHSFMNGDCEKIIEIRKALAEYFESHIKLDKLKVVMPGDNLKDKK